MQVLREVKVLSSLQHPNIVGYHTAWMEHVQPAVKGMLLYIDTVLNNNKSRNIGLITQTGLRHGSIRTFKGSVCGIGSG